MAVTLSVEDDLVPFAPTIDSGKAEIMIADALAMAARVAPCILEDDFAYEDAAKAILRGAILRWNDSSTGGAAVTQLVAGPQQISFANETRKSLFSPSEAAALARLCSQFGGRTAFSVDSLPEDT